MGFLRRDNQAIIVQFLGEATMMVLQGLPITLFSQGDFWAKFAAGASPGQLVFADPGTGQPIAAATAPTIFSGTADAGFAGTASVGAAFTIVIATNVATISAVTGYVSAGDVVTSANIAGVAIGAQLTGTPGAAGTYTFVHANVASEAATSTSNTLNVTAVTRGNLEVGSVIAGGGLTGTPTVTSFTAGTGGVGRYVFSGAQQASASGAKTAQTTLLNVTAVTLGDLNVGDVVGGATSGSPQVASQVSGTPGGIGTYRLTSLQGFAPGVITVGAVATPWKVNSLAAAGELAKISTWG